MQSYACFDNSSASRQALASWSPQEVGRPLQEMPPIFSSTCSTVSPSTSFGIACRLPLQPPVNFTLCTMLPSSSNSIFVEQVPFVLYVYVMTILLVFRRKMHALRRAVISFPNSIIYAACRRFNTYEYIQGEESMQEENSMKLCKIRVCCSDQIEVADGEKPQAEPGAQRLNIQIAEVD